MIDEAPLLTVKKTFARASAELLAPFRDAPCAQICDAMGGNGAMNYRIGPLPGLPERFIGVALTCDNGPGDNLATTIATGLAEAGDVIVAATDGFTNTGVVGDLMIGMMQNRGVAAFVTDGVVRDLPDLRRIGLPVFAQGVIPNSVHRSGPGTVGLPVVCGGVAVSPGDIVIGDADGVVVVPQARAAEIAARLKIVRENEAGTLEKVKAGLKTPGVATELLAGNRIKFID